MGITAALLVGVAVLLPRCPSSSSPCSALFLLVVAFFFRVPVVFFVVVAFFVAGIRVALAGGRRTLVGVLAFLVMEWMFVC